MTRLHRLLALGTGASLVALTAHLGLQQAARTGIERALAAAGPALRHGPVTVDTLSGRASVRDLAFEKDGISVRVGRVVLPTPYAMVAPALAAGDLTVDNIAIDTPNGAVKVPRLTLSGTGNSREEVMAVFDLAAASPLSARLAALSAASASMPELVIETHNGEARSNAVYRDLRISGLAAGVIRSMAASGGTFEGSGRDASSMRGVYGPMTATEIDLPLIAKFYLERTDNPPAELKTAYGSFSIEGLAATSSMKGKDQARFAISRMSGKGFKLRPVREPLLPLVREFADRGQQDKLEPKERSRLVNAIVDLYESMAVDTMEASDIQIEGASGEGRGKIARIAFTGAQVGRPNEVRVENIDISGKDGYGRIGLISHSGWSYKATLAAVRDAFGKPDASPDEVNPRAFIPELGTLTVRDMEFDVPDVSRQADDAKAPNIHAGLKTFEIQASDPLEGVPTALRLSADRLTMPIRPGDKKDGLRELATMGYKELDLTAGFDTRWSEASGDLALNQLSLQAVNMGGVSLRGTIGNIAKEVFTGDQTAQQIALLGATVKQATLVVENKGLFEKALEFQAKGARKSPDQLRKELAAAAQMGVPAFLGNGANAKQIASALSKFIAKPGRLTLAAKSRDPAGVGLADFGAAGGDPRALLEAVTITATAE